MLSSQALGYEVDKEEAESLILKEEERLKTKNTALKVRALDDAIKMRSEGHMKMKSKK